MKKLLLLLSIAYLLIGCGFSKPDYLVMVSPNDLNQILQKEDVFLVDVHIPEQKHIPGTDLFAPFNEVAQFKEKLPADKNTAIYLYCKSGPMANSAAKTLHELGYIHLYNLEGGSDAWQQAGLPLQ